MVAELCYDPAIEALLQNLRTARPIDASLVGLAKTVLTILVAIPAGNGDDREPVPHLGKSQRHRGSDASGNAAEVV